MGQTWSLELLLATDPFHGDLHTTVGPATGLSSSSSGIKSFVKASEMVAMMTGREAQDVRVQDKLEERTRDRFHADKVAVLP